MSSYSGGVIWLVIVTATVVMVAGPIFSVNANFYGKRGTVYASPQSYSCHLCLMLFMHALFVTIYITVKINNHAHVSDLQAGLGVGGWGGG